MRHENVDERSSANRRRAYYQSQIMVDRRVHVAMFAVSHAAAQETDFHDVTRTKTSWTHSHRCHVRLVQNFADPTEQKAQMSH